MSRNISRGLILFGVFVALMTVAAGAFTSGCRHCICKIEGCEKKIGECTRDVYSDSCGPFQLKLPYWCDANGIYPCPRAQYDQEWRNCTKYMPCSVKTVDKYMARYGTKCAGSNPTCEDYARIHNGGPKGCKKIATLPYWVKVKLCCATEGGC